VLSLREDVRDVRPGFVEGADSELEHFRPESRSLAARLFPPSPCTR
jgi:hypothetical protein